MPTLDASGFKKRMRLKMIKVRAEVPKICLAWAEEVYDDIESGSDLLAPSWKAAKRSGGRGQYFKPIGMDGLFEAIRSSRSVMVLGTTANNYMIGIGSESLMDASAYNTESNTAYWRLFEYGTLGSRAGASTRGFGFVPTPGGTQAGHKALVSPLGRANRPHPGVLPVFLFGDTTMAKMPILRSRLRTRVIDIIRKG
jgi:hypothetical protein